MKLTGLINQPQIHSHEQGFAIYNPIRAYNYGDTVIVAEVITYSNIDNEIEIQRYASRGWAYWNWCDQTTGDFTFADQMLQIETELRDGINDNQASIQTTTIEVTPVKGLFGDGDDTTEMLIQLLNHYYIGSQTFWDKLAEHTWFNPVALRRMHMESHHDKKQNLIQDIRNFRELSPM